MVKNVLEDLLDNREQIDQMNCEKLVKSVYKLNDLEFETYCTILMYGAQPVVDIREHLNSKPQYASNPKDRTMISRSLKQLHEKHLVIRKSETKVNVRGYYHVYSAKSLDEITEELNSYIDEWYERAKTEIASITDHFDTKKEKELSKANV